MHCQPISCEVLKKFELEFLKKVYIGYMMFQVKEQHKKSKFNRKMFRDFES